MHVGTCGYIKVLSSPQSFEGELSLAVMTTSKAVKGAKDIRIRTSGAPSRALSFSSLIMRSCLLVIGTYMKSMGKLLNRYTYNRFMA